MRQQNEAGSSFQGCLNSYRDAVDAAMMTTEPGTPMRNKMMTAAYLRYVNCCRLPKALIVAPDDVKRAFAGLSGDLRVLSGVARTPPFSSANPRH
jgi:hypothetical protein